MNGHHRQRLVDGTIGNLDQVRAELARIEITVKRPGGMSFASIAGVVLMQTKALDALEKGMRLLAELEAGRSPSETGGGAS